MIPGLTSSGLTGLTDVVFEEDEGDRRFSLYKGAYKGAASKYTYSIYDEKVLKELEEMDKWSIELL